MFFTTWKNRYAYAFRWLDSTFFSKMYLKRNPYTYSFQDIKGKELNLVGNGDKWIRYFFIDQIKNTFTPYKYMNNIKLQAKKDQNKRSIQNL